MQLNALQQRCAAGEPLAYIVGEKEFWSLSLTVNPAVLIPRPETEMLVEAVLNLQDIGAASKILDAGTGSGAIAVALAHTLRAEDKALPKIIACDVSFDSLRIAQKNIDRHCRHDVQLVQADWLQGFDKQQFDVIVSNPPYIAEDDVHVAEDVRQHEPGVALFSIDNGLGAIQTLVKDSLKVGKSGSILLMEHGFMQAAAVQQLFTQHGYVDVITVKDYNGHDRITSGRCP